MDCFAYSKKGQRCDGLAGHEGKHQFTVTWTDEECWAPGDMIEVTLKEYGTPNFGQSLPDAVAEAEQSLGPVPVYGASKPGTCALCDHAMHVRDCNRCDCRAGIPG